MLKFKELDDKKKRLIIIVSVLVVFIGVTLAYVVGQISDGAIGNANVTADTTDNLQFSVDKDISLNPTQFNVTEGGGGLSDTAVGTATLLANSTNEAATYDYYVYFRINNNNYIYTTDDAKPEIVLTILDPDNNPITSLDGLEYVTVQNADGTTVSGFDITTQKGMINVAKNYEITSNSSTDTTVQDWTFTVTFINLTTNQTENGGSILDAEVILSQDGIIDYHILCESGTLACDIARLYNEDNPESNGIYYHNGTIVKEPRYCMYNGNSVLSFPDGNPSTSTEDCQSVYYVTAANIYADATIITYGVESGMTEEVSWNSTGGSCQTASGIPVYNETFEIAVSQEECSGYAIISGPDAFLAVEVGSGNMIGRILDAEDYSYRYAGANPNNYVCFGSDETICPVDNLYRIIGVFGNQVKLVKYDYANIDLLGTDGDYVGTAADLGMPIDNYKGMLSMDNVGLYFWNYNNGSSSANDWSTSRLNIVNLNKNYLNNIGSKWSDLIAMTAWQVGNGFAFYDYEDVDLREIYNRELESNRLSNAYKAKIGLIYLSDYGYASSLENWSINLSNSNNILSDNWMYMGLYDLTISRVLNATELFIIDFEGRITSGEVSIIRPSFYLNPNVKLVAGTGTESNPYRISL